MDDTARWNAVLHRDPASARAFIYAVRTTGIYCVPTCPSRRPKRENVEFFADPAEAQRAGYRPCKRCNPDAQRSPEDDVVAQVCGLVFATETPPSLQEMAAHVGVSASHLHRSFKARTGQTPREFAADVRATRVREALARGVGVTQALYEAGYSSSSRFYGEAAEALGMPPSRYRDGGRDVSIQVALTECTLGHVLVATTGAGVCAVALGDTPEPLLAALRKRFARATFLPSDPAFERTVAEVVAAVEGTAPTTTLPLDIRGTAFQHRVWRALQAIPVGTTTTYGELAAALGRPDAARAVAAACAANELAVLVPCHRVVGSDGALRGYRWGLERKRALLQREAE